MTSKPIKPKSKPKPKPKRAPGFSTRAIHAGYRPEPRTGSVMPPLYLTSTFEMEHLGKYRDGYDYSRSKHPNRVMLERTMASLEGGRYASAYASGVAAVTAVMGLLKPGDHVVASESIYGGTYRLFERILRGQGLDLAYADVSRPENIERAATPRTRLVYIESPTNPLLRLVDLRAVSKVCRKHRWLHAVDNTFMTPVFQQPLSHGVSIVIHSTTKFLNGHSDSLGGVVVTSSKRLADWLHFLQKSTGAILSPFDCWLVLRSLKTLVPRMAAHERNARRLAKFLDGHRKVKRVIYPGLASHPQHSLAKRQAGGFGAIITFDLGSKQHAARFLNSLKLCILAESLGGVETLVSQPATMSHAFVPTAEKERLGITEGLVRISVGVEDVEDLEEDLQHALAKL
jgi:cystathionine beta-lyase/cystathionine gamma-synthase